MSNMASLQKARVQGLKNNCACVVVCGKSAGSGGSLYECLHQVVTQNEPIASPEYNLVPRGRYTVEPRYNEPLYKELSPRYHVGFSLPK